MDKQKFLNLIKTNKYLQKFVTYVYRYESDKTKGGFNNLGGFNRTSGNSTAFGAGQFTTDTRNDILAKYGIDAWSPNAQDQEAAMIALLDYRGVLDEISVGNYKALDRPDLWETFTEGMPGYEPILNEGIMSDMDAAEALEAERMNSKYAPDESLAQMFPKMYQEKMALFEKDGVFPLDNIAGIPEYEEVASRASEVQKGIKDKLAPEEPPVETKKPTKKPIKKSTVVDTSKLNKSQTTVYNDIVARIDADTDYNEEEKNILKAKSFAEVLDAENINDLRRTRNINLGGLYSEHLADVKKSRISKLSRLKEDSSLSFEDRDLADKYLTSLKRPASTSIRDTYGMNIPSYSEENISNFLSRFDSVVPEPVKTETPAKPTAPIAPTQPAQPQAREEVPLVKLDTKGVTSIPTEGISGEPEGWTSKPPAKKPKPITKAGEAIMKARIAAMRVGEGMRDLGLNGESVSNALRAGAGILSLYEATKKDKVNKARVSPLMLEAVRKAEEISNTGMPYEQKMAAIKDLNNAYSGAMKNVMAISGGQRGAALAGMGAVDASRVNALVDLAAKSSDMRMEGMKMYQKAVGDYTQAKLTADMSNEKLQKSLDQARKDRMSKQGISLYEQAMEFNRNFKDQENNEALINAINNSSQQGDNNANQYAMSALAQMFANMGAGGSDTENTVETIN